MQALHKFNPVRVAYLRELLGRYFSDGGEPRNWRSARALDGLTILDIGCGAGILSEPLARLGARITAIDPASRNIEVAREHAAKAGLSIDYRCISAEALVAEGARFDAVLAMEVIEHVNDVENFLRLASGMVRPGGLLAAATLNRTLKSFAFAIVGAEYVLRWVPRGTHRWSQFVTPQELAKALRAAGLHIKNETGVVYDPVAANGSSRMTWTSITSWPRFAWNEVLHLPGNYGSEWRQPPARRGQKPHPNRQKPFAGTNASRGTRGYLRGREASANPAPVSIERRPDCPALP